MFAEPPAKYAPPRPSTPAAALFNPAMRESLAARVHKVYLEKLIGSREPVFARSDVLVGVAY